MSKYIEGNGNQTSGCQKTVTNMKREKARVDPVL